MKHSLYVFMLLVSCLHPGIGYAQRAHQAPPAERIQPAEHMQPTGRTPPPAELANLFATAREQNKNVLAYITASWCSACHEFEKEVLPLPEVTDSLKNFAFVKASLDESALGALLARKYSLQTIPAFLLISPSGELLHYQTGIGVGTIFFFQMMADYKVKNRIGGYSTDFAMHYPDFYQTFFPSYKNAPDSSAIDRYLDTQSDLESEVNFDIFMTMPTGIRYKSYFLSHGLYFSEKYGPIYGERVVRLYLSDLRRMIREKDKAAYRLLEDAHYFVDSIM